MATKIPSFTTTCLYSTEMNGSTWYIYLKSSGTFRFDYAKKDVDIFLQGGGGGGVQVYTDSGNGGGAGGYQATVDSQTISSSEQSVTIGAGGAPNTAGEATSAFGSTAAGGGTGSGLNGGTAGTGAGGNGGWYWDGNNTGYPGENGANGKLAFGTGSVYYGAGGGGSPAKFNDVNGAGGNTGGGAGGGGNATANTGSGGGGGGGSGGSGIVIIRGTEDDALPVYFDGTQLQEIYFNGELLKGLIYGGTRLFARVLDWLRVRRIAVPEMLDA